jgi:hypothetical protein
MAKKVTKSGASTPKAATPEWGGLPVKEVEPEETVAEVDVTVGDEQPVATDCPVGKPRGKRRAKPDCAPSGAEGARDGDVAAATPTPKSTKKRVTSRPKAATAAKGKQPTARARRRSMSMTTAGG